MVSGGKISKQDQMKALLELCRPDEPSTSASSGGQAAEQPSQPSEGASSGVQEPPRKQAEGEPTPKMTKLELHELQAQALAGWEPDYELSLIHI